MNAHSEVVLWAARLIRERIAELETCRAKAARRWRRGKGIHKLRVLSRKLRAALEDLSDCFPNAADSIAACKTFAAQTAQAQDGAAMLARVQRYRRFALPAERAEIAMVSEHLAATVKAGRKRAKRAVKSCRFWMEA
ncbi:MAG: hypothetical protein NVS1B14_08640 [Vulcanimicrobiaceae bacterium]